jgi:CubicO group peptidase (beta-lactamase class C family)
MQIARVTALAVYSATLVSVAATPDDQPVRAAAIAACMTRASAELRFSGSVYARRGADVIEREFATSDADGKVPVTSRTRFNLASASKMFTAVAIGRLVDRGAVRFDAPIGEYLRELKPEFAAITVAQLLNHTAGLGDYFTATNKEAIDAAHTATDLLPLALATVPEFTPGSKRAYSNSGYVVLGAIIERVSGMSYTEFLSHEILAPLGMVDTRFDAQGSADPMTRMSPEGPLDQPILSPLRQLRTSPAGGLFSTPSDVSAFLAGLMDGRLLRPDTLNAMLLPRPDPGGGAGTYGYGFKTDLQSPGRFGHGGGAPGANTEVVFYPASGWQLIALSNSDPPVASQMVAVMETVIFAPNTTEACAAALADPGLHRRMQRALDAGYGADRITGVVHLYPPLR